MLDPVAPDVDAVTDYDRRHLFTYAELLDADADGVAWREGALEILGIDPDKDAPIACACWQSHLARARWIRGAGLGLAIATFGASADSPA